MMEQNEKKLLIMGIGNILMGDEGIGVHVVQQLEKEKLPACVECLDGGTGSFYLLEPMQLADRIILIDAAAFDDAPGSIRQLTPKFSRSYPRTLTAHDIGLKDLLDGFYLLEDEPDIRLIAVTIDPRQILGIGLSAEVAGAADQVMHIIRHEIMMFQEEIGANETSTADGENS